FENSRGTEASFAFAVFLLAGLDSFLEVGFAADLAAFLAAGLVSLAAFLALGAPPFLLAPFFEGAFSGANRCALFRAGGGFGGRVGFCVRHRGVYPFGGW